MRVGNGHVVREESHLDDMRAAIRGDFERLEERRGEQVLLRPREHSELEASVSDDPVSEVDAPTLEAVPGDEPLPAPKRSWIDRLLGQ